MEKESLLPIILLEVNRNYIGELAGGYPSYCRDKSMLSIQDN
jgi:hypothetical protein